MPRPGSDQPACPAVRGHAEGLRRAVSRLPVPAQNATIPRSLIATIRTTPYSSRLSRRGWPTFKARPNDSIRSTRTSSSSTSPRRMTADSARRSPSSFGTRLPRSARPSAPGARVAAIEAEIEDAREVLANRVGSFLIQLRDLVEARLLDKHEAFRVFRRLLNYTPDTGPTASPSSTTSSSTTSPATRPWSATATTCVSTTGTSRCSR